MGDTINLKEVKDIIEYLKGMEHHQVLNYLKKYNIDIPIKNLIYLYLFPRPLLDMELPYRIINQRKSNGNQSGYLTPNISEISLIIEAYRTQQYRRFIKHLLHSFTDPSNIFPVNGNGQCNCNLCGKGLYEFESWSSICSRFPEDYKEKKNKEFLAYGSLGSNLSLCVDCIIQLTETRIILNEIEPNFLEVKFKK